MRRLLWPIKTVLVFIGWSILILEIFSLLVTIVLGGSIPSKLGNFVVLWLVLAYLFLPKLHRKLTKLYLPNYFIARTRTSEGFLGDPVNIAFNGTKTQLHKAMQQAGWVLADTLNWRSSIKMIIRTVTFRSYPSAPVSSLFLFSNKQDFAYQMEVNGSTSARHHIRFWKVPSGFWLPGGKKADWLAAATYDRKVGFSTLNLQITHKIEEDIDIEREFVIDSLEKSGVTISKKIEKHYVAGFRDKNGGGDRIKTDGNMPFISLLK